MAPLADLYARQLWWIGAVVATSAGLWLVFGGGRHWLIRIGGVALAFVPHVIGAPMSAEPNVVPEEIMRQFVIASLGTSALFWAVHYREVPHGDLAHYCGRVRQECSGGRSSSAISRVVAGDAFSQTADREIRDEHTPPRDLRLSLVKFPLMRQGRSEQKVRDRVRPICEDGSAKPFYRFFILSSERPSRSQPCCTRGN
jgi:hypothetical protein